MKKVVVALFATLAVHASASADILTNECMPGYMLNRGAIPTCTDYTTGRTYMPPFAQYSQAEVTINVAPKKEEKEESRRNVTINTGGSGGKRRRGQDHYIPPPPSNGPYLNIGGGNILDTSTGRVGRAIR